MDVSLATRPIGGLLTAAIVAAVLLLLAVRSIRRTTPRRRAILSALRAAAAVLVICALVRPSLVYTTRRKQPASLIVLADRSRSMLTPDAFGGGTRWSAAAGALEESTEALRRLDAGDDFNVQVYSFAEAAEALDLAALPGALPETPDGRLTALGDVLRDVLLDHGGSPLAGLVLLSDGAVRALAPRDLPPQLAARLYADAGCPIYTVRFGEPRGVSQARDAALNDLIAPQSVFVKNELSVAASATFRGLAGREIPVRLEFEQADGSLAPVAEVLKTAEEDGERVRVDASFTPEAAGEFKLSMVVEEQPGELVTSNNRLSTFITVKPGGLKVLYVEGVPRAEQRFLRRALDASPDIRVDYEWIDPRGRAGWPQEHAAWFEPGAYDIYLFGDVDSSVFREEDLAALAERIDAGAGFGMLGGLRSFGAGGYAGTPLAAALPVEVQAYEATAWGDPPSETAQLDGPVRLLPSAAAGGAVLMRLAPGAANRAAWEQLPELLGGNRFSEVKPNATILGESAAGDPLLVVGQYGGGRTLALSVDSTWRWAMQGDGETHRRFWRRVALWLAKQDERTGDDVWLELPQRRYSPLAAVEFTAGSTGPEGEPSFDAELTAEVVAPDGTVASVPLLRDGDRYRGAFGGAVAAGDYRLVVIGRRAGVEIGRAEARFLIYERDLELDNPAADPSLLASLSAATAESGGKAIPPELLPELLEELRADPPDFDVETQTSTPLWNNWPFFLLLVGLLCADWYLRKRWGLP